MPATSKLQNSSILVEQQESEKEEPTRELLPPNGIKKQQFLQQEKLKVSPVHFQDANNQKRMKNRPNSLFKLVIRDQEVPEQLSNSQQNPLPNENQLPSIANFIPNRPSPVPKHEFNYSNNQNYYEHQQHNHVPSLQQYAPQSSPHLQHHHQYHHSNSNIHYHQVPPQLHNLYPLPAPPPQHHIIHQHQQFYSAAAAAGAPPPPSSPVQNGRRQFFVASSPVLQQQQKSPVSPPQKNSRRNSPPMASVKREEKQQIMVVDAEAEAAPPLQLVVEQAAAAAVPNEQDSIAAQHAQPNVAPIIKIPNQKVVHFIPKDCSTKLVANCFRNTKKKLAVVVLENTLASLVLFNGVRYRKASGDNVSHNSLMYQFMKQNKGSIEQDKDQVYLVLCCETEIRCRVRLYATFNEKWSHKLFFKLIRRQQEHTMCFDVVKSIDQIPQEERELELLRLIESPDASALVEMDIHKESLSAVFSFPLTVQSKNYLHDLILYTVNEHDEYVVLCWLKNSYVIPLGSFTSFSAEDIVAPIR